MVLLSRLLGRKGPVEDGLFDTWSSVDFAQNTLADEFPHCRDADHDGLHVSIRSGPAPKLDGEDGSVKETLLTGLSSAMSPLHSRTFASVKVLTLPYPMPNPAKTNEFSTTNSRMWARGRKAR